MDRWDVFILAVASYVAIVSLVRLMANRRNELVAKIRTEITKQRDAAAARDNEEADRDAA